jgi:hypothetical protein
MALPWGATGPKPGISCFMNYLLFYSHVKENKYDIFVRFRLNKILSSG